MVKVRPADNHRQQNAPILHGDDSELISLRAENKLLRELVTHLSSIVIRRVVDEIGTER
jgi:hypothetical protein